MNKLQFEDLINIQKIELNEAKFTYLDHHETNNVMSNSSSIPEISLQVKTKDISLKNKYDENIKDQILKDYVFKLKEKEPTNIVEIKNIHNILRSEQRSFIAKLMKASNQIVMKSRIGPANHVIMDPIYYKFFDKNLLNNSNLTIKTYPKLGDNVIVYRKYGSLDQPGPIFIHNEKYYAFDEIGDYSTHYNVVKIKCDYYIRQKKLKRILDESTNQDI